MPQTDFLYGEIFGKLDGDAPARPLTQNAIILSNLSHGVTVGSTAVGMGIKYVARGTEYYTIQGRTHKVTAGQFMCMSQGLPNEAEIKRTGDTTLGLCMFIRGNPDELHSDIFEQPLVFAANSSALGRNLTSGLKDLTHPTAERSRVAEMLLGSISSNLDLLLEDTSSALEALHSLRPATRFETMRKLEIARGYLHEITHRPVELAELAAVAGVSRFQLLRNFRTCYGAPPATYHRCIRLGLAKKEIDNRRLTCGEAAHRFGFADASSFSHAYRRVFGEAPMRARLPV